MPQSLSMLATHLVFSTKNREPFLKNPDLQIEVEKYISTILKNNDSPVIAIKVMPDHIHVLFLLSRTHSVSELVQTIKRDSSKWIKTKSAINPFLEKFHWQSGYSIFAVSKSVQGKVIAYIQNQEEHHKSVSFNDEYLSLLKKHELEYDEKYLWD